MAQKKAEILKAALETKSVPPSILQAIRILQDPDANMGEVVQFINYDPGLTANVLKLANSSYFGCKQSISSLKDAIVRLGAETVFKLLVTSIANVTLSKGIYAYNIAPGELWEHSIACAVATEVLAEQLQTKNPNIAFTAGLLHDFGKVILGNFIDKDDYDSILQCINEGNDFYDAERKIMGISHAELGAHMLKYWNIPDELVSAIRWHHRPVLNESEPIPALINMADCICVAANLGSGEKYFKPRLNKDAFRRFGVTEKLCNEVIERTRSSITNIKDVFSKCS